MLNWPELFANGLWLLGLALVLATLSVAGYTRQLRQIPRPRLWSLFSTSLTIGVGVLLFCLGMAASSNSTLASAAWLLLAALPVANGWRILSLRVVAQGSAPVDIVPAAPSAPDSLLKSAAIWLVRTELLWLLLLAPPVLLFLPDSLPLLIVLPLLAIAHWIAYGRFMPQTPLDLPILLLLGMLLVSLFVSWDITLSWRNASGLLLGVALYYALIEFMADRQRVRWGFAAYAVAASVFAVVVLLGTAWPYKVPLLRNFLAQLPALTLELSANYGFQPNEMAATLLWIVPLLLALAAYLWLARPDGKRSSLALLLLFTLALLLTTATLLSTQSRGAISALLLAGLILIWLLVKRVRVAIAALAFVACMLVVAAGPDAIFGSLYRNFGPGFSLANLGHDLWIRPETYWSPAIYAIDDFPLTGIGMGTYRPVVNALYGSNLEDIANNRHALSQLLQTALDLGLPGLVAYIAILLGGWALALSAFRRAPDPWSRVVAAGAGAALFANALHTTIDTVPLGDASGLFFWALLGLLVGLWQQYVGKAETWSKPPFPSMRFAFARSQRRKVAIPSVASIAALLTLWLLIPRLATATVVNTASVALEQGATDAAGSGTLKSLLQSVASTSGGSAPYRKLGQLLILDGNPAQVVVLLQSVAQSYADDRVLSLQLGDARQLVADSAGALEAWRQAGTTVQYLLDRGLTYYATPEQQIDNETRLALATQLWPQWSNAQFELGLFYQQQSDEEKAAVAFKRSLDLNSWTDDPAGVVSVYMAHVYLGHLLNYFDDLVGSYDQFQAAADLIAHDPQKTNDLITLHKLMAMVRQRQGQPAEAIAHLTQALALGDDDAATYYSLSVAEGDAAQYQKAIAHAEMAIARDASDPRYYEFLAELYLNTGDKAAAKGALERGLLVAADDAELQAALRGLGSH